MINFNKNVVSATDVGLVRKANEDSLGLAQTPNGYLFVVCDGMGGHVGGATASKIAVNSIVNYLSSKTYNDISLALTEALCVANNEILNEVARVPELRGMGTTACVVLVQPEAVWFAHVGDSRIYLRTNNQLHRITKDHSLVQGLVDQGMITDAEAENHPQKNRILKALGIAEDLKPTVCAEPLLPAKNDIILICSDGLNGMVNDLTMQAVLLKHTTLQEKCDELITLAKRAGGSDNITAILVETKESPHKVAAFVSYSPKEYLPISFWEKHRSGIIYTCLFLFLLVGGSTSYYFTKKKLPIKADQEVKQSNQDLKGDSIHNISVDQNNGSDSIITNKQLSPNKINETVLDNKNDSAESVPKLKQAKDSTELSKDKQEKKYKK